MSSLSETIRRVQTRMDLEQLKMPLGFIRVLELLFSLIAYVSLNSFDFDLKFTCNFSSKMSINRVYSLQNLNLANLQITKCDNTTTPLFVENYGGGGDFFAYLTVISIFFAVASLIIYIFWWSVYVSDDRAPIIDLIITIVFSFSFLIGTYCFSAMAGRIEEATKPESVIKLLNDVNYCKSAVSCTHLSYAMYSPLTVTIIAGVGSLMLYSANIWFVYKETANYRAQTTRNIQLQQQDPYTLE